MEAAVDVRLHVLFVERAILTNRARKHHPENQKVKTDEVKLICEKIWSFSVLQHNYNLRI